MNKLKRLVILDLDDTQFPALPRLDKCLSQLMSEFARVRGIGISCIKDLVREAHGQHRFNDGAGLVDAIVTTDSNFLLKEEWKKTDIRIKADWIQESQNLTVFFPGVFESLKYWKSAGVNIVIQTDCEDIAAIRNLWMLGVNAHTNGGLESPFDIIDFYDAVYCQKGIEPSQELMKSIPSRFLEQARRKLHIWDDRLYKPEASHIKKILSDANVEADEALYIGDSHKDGAEARLAHVDFVWARYGTIISQSTLDMCACVASRNFTYGEAAISDKLVEQGISPVVTLHTNMRDVLSFYRWGSPYTKPV